MTNRKAEMLVVGKSSYLTNAGDVPQMMAAISTLRWGLIFIIEHVQSVVFLLRN